MEWPSLDEFESMVVAELDALPDDMIAGLDNVVIFVEDAPAKGEEILGVYEGVALTERGDYGLGELPDRIVIYRTPLLEMARDREHLIEEIRITLIHEIAHYYGIDDNRLHELGWA